MSPDETTAPAAPPEPEPTTAPESPPEPAEAAATPFGDPKVLQLRELADGLIRQLLRFVKGEGPEKIRIMSELKDRLVHYAANGDQEGLELVYGRIVGEVIDAKLEAEEELLAGVRLVGGFLLDAAEKVLPRLIGLIEKQLGEA